MEADGEAAAARLRLAAASGWTATEPPEPAGDLPEPVPPADAARLLERARAAQPARRLALAMLGEARARQRLAGREGFPDPILGVEYEHEEGSTDIWLATLGLPLPLFQRNQAARAEAAAEADIARADVEAIDATLPARIRALAATADAAARRVAVFRSDVLPRFEDNLALLRRAFELGELDALEVSVARGRLVDAQRAALDAYEDYFGAMADLASAVGDDTLTRTP
jgi:outer membrane protein, heavy metal efflux system